MARDESLEGRIRGVALARHPRDHKACGGCIFYEPRSDAEGYCAQPDVRLNVATTWWCRYYDANESKAKLTGHPLHPAIIPFPLALTTTALIFDILDVTTGQSRWRQNAKYSLILGTVGGLLAAPMGMMDWLALPSRRPAKAYGLVHGLGNVLLLAINGFNIGLRNGKAKPSNTRRGSEIALSVVANVLSFGTGWLGGQLSYRFGVGVEHPSKPYRILEFEPVVRLTDQVEWRDGRVNFPAESVWSGPAVPSQPVPGNVESQIPEGQWQPPLVEGFPLQDTGEL